MMQKNSLWGMKK